MRATTRPAGSYGGHQHPTCTAAIKAEWLSSELLLAAPHKDVAEVTPRGWRALSPPWGPTGRSLSPGEGQQPASTVALPQQPGLDDSGTMPRAHSIPCCVSQLWARSRGTSAGSSRGNRMGKAALGPSIPFVSILNFPSIEEGGSETHSRLTPPLRGPCQQPWLGWEGAAPGAWQHPATLPMPAASWMLQLLSSWALAGSCPAPVTSPKRQRSARSGSGSSLSALSLSPGQGHSR